jgi:dipeptidyl aminopeptidase/acylaminoacyl peptidase
MKHLGILVLLFFASTLRGQSFNGHIAYGKTSFNYRIKLIEIENQTRAFFSSPEMNAFEIPCQNTTFDKDSLKFYVISDYYTYEYRYLRKSGNLKGRLKVYSNETEQLLNTFETDLTLEDISESDHIEKQEFSFTSNGIGLSGTLWKPKNPNNIGLLFVTSSQGNDRSGTNAEAYYFADLGYTVFHYDKRGTGKSEGDWQSATLEELCYDDINALEFFSQTSSISLADMGIKGSSQGGIKVPFILSKLPELGFGIAVSCPSGTLLESDLNYWKNVNIDQVGNANVDRAQSVQKAGYDYLAGNISYPSMLEIKNENLNEDWLKYVWFPERDAPKDYKLNFSGLPYFEEVTQPILVIQGLSDQVIPEDSYSTIENVLKKSKSKEFKIRTFENTTHSMTYLDKEVPYFQLLTPGYLEEITQWLKTVKTR